MQKSSSPSKTKEMASVADANHLNVVVCTRRGTIFGAANDAERTVLIVPHLGHDQPVQDQPKVIDPDGELVAAIAAGDQSAARELLNRHLTRLLNVAYRLLGNRDDAEEVVQDVFLKVWTHAVKWEPGRAKFETWMHRVTLNLCYDRLRRRKEVNVEEMPDQTDERPGPAETLQQSQIAMQVRAAMQELPERQRAALTLCHLQGVSNIEAAQIMEISVEAVESLLARARRGLKVKLKESAGDLVGGV